MGTDTDNVGGDFYNRVVAWCCKVGLGRFCTLIFTKSRRYVCILSDRLGGGGGSI